jgi:hypothetical protein
VSWSGIESSKDSLAGISTRRMRRVRSEEELSEHPASDVDIEMVGRSFKILNQTAKSPADIHVGE